MARVTINGRPLDATFSVNQGDAPDRFLITIDSGSGASPNRLPRNPDYRKGFAAILARLGAIEAVVEGAHLAPTTGKLRNTRSLLEVDGRPYPWSLSRSDALERSERLRRDLARAQERTNSEASSGGNSTKRVELTVNLRAPHSVKQLEDLLVFGLQGDDPSTVNSNISAANGESATPKENSVDAGIGRPYSRPDRLPTVAPREPFDTDPDLVDRGNRAHVLTLDSLADFLRLHDIKPFLPVGEPMFDLAWMDQGVVFVAEVKSITAANEEKQLRLGLGQVLRYRQILQSLGMKVVPVLVPEKEPSEAGWIDLCNELSVRLVWPGAFDSIRGIDGR
jgi:hypothetical protein